MKYLLALTLLLFVTACGNMENTKPVTQKPSQKTVLENKQWQLVELAGQPVIHNSNITMKLDGKGIISGRGGCNSYSGGYEVIGSRIQVEQNLISTMMACVDQEFMKQEARYLTILPAVKTYEINDNQILTITTKDNENLKFSLTETFPQ